MDSTARLLFYLAYYITRRTTTVDYDSLGF